MTSLIRFILPDTMKDLANFSKEAGDNRSALSCQFDLLSGDTENKQKRLQ
jgi:hypothetical protein